MVNRNPYLNWPLWLYLYLVRAYSKFLTVGKCLSYPLILQIQTQSLCNARCSICPYPTTSKRLANGAMEWNLFEKIATELASETEASTLLLTLHNEPLLDKRLFDWVKHIKSISPDKSCTIATNGEFLDRFSITEILQSGLDRLTISLNAHSRETYESINTGLDYDRVMKNVYYLLSDRSMRRKVELKFLLTGENAHEVKQALDYWKSQEVQTRVCVITNRGGSLDNYERLRFKDTQYSGAPLWRFWKRLMFIGRGVIGCELPFYQMNILFNGDAIVCCHDWNRATVVGNARTSSLREIWNSDRMNGIRLLILRKRYKQINSCKECSLIK